MPPLALLLPIALLLVASVAAMLLCRFGAGASRAAVAAGAWAAAGAIVAIWLPLRSTLELTFGPLGFGVPFGLRLDAVAVGFGLIVLVPAALLLTLQRRSWQESAVTGLALAAAVLATEAGDVVLTAVGGCTAATLAVIALGIEDLEAPRPLWSILIAAWLALAWAGVQLQVQGGTAGYAVVPVSALTAPVMALIVFAAIAASGLYPWRGWASRIWSRPSLVSGAVAAAMLPPLGLYLLFRAYEMGNGRYPQTGINIALAAWGALVAFGAATRAQAAGTRRDYMAEILPALGGFAFLFASIGSTVGLVAALIVMASAALLVVCIALAADRPGLPSLLVVAAGTAMPAGLGFGAMLLGLAAAFEAGDAFGVIGVAGVATWLLLAAAAARSAALPAGGDGSAIEARPRIAAVLAGAALAAGPALGLVFAAGSSAASDVLPSSGPAPGLTAISTVSTVLPVIALLGPLLVVGVIALALSRPVPQASRSEPRPSLFKVPFAASAARVWALTRSATMPADYRSLFNPRALEAAAAGATPVLWLAALVALAIAVTR